MKKHANVFRAFIPLAVLILAQSPQEANGDDPGTCFTCSPWPANPVYCVPNQQDEGYDDCEGQCDMRDGKPCGPPTFALLAVPVAEDRLEVDSHFLVRGQQLSADAFAVRACDGSQLDMIYTQTGLASRRARARVIEFQPTNAD